MAGFRELLAVEWDIKAAATFKENFPAVPVFQDDIGKLTINEALSLMGLKQGELDVLDGSPPCQGFSTAGKRVLDDSRNALFQQYARLLEGLKPKVLIMENVSGLVKGKMKLIFAEIMRALKASGYKVRCQLLNAMHYQVPQSRQRLIFIGVREDLKIEPSFPKGQTRLISVREAIGHLPVGEAGKHQKQVLDAWIKCKPGLSLREIDMHVGSYQSVRLNPKKPSRVQIAMHRNWHWLKPRLLTILETGIIGSFPEQFKFGKGGFAQIGNSVPPLFMRAIASHVKAILLKGALLECARLEALAAP